MNNFQKASETLEQVKEALSHDAKDRASEGIDELAKLLSELGEADEMTQEDKKNLLESLAELARVYSPLFSIINIVFQAFR